VVTAPGTSEAPKPPYANPVFNTDCPDPGVLEVGDPVVYYAVCTGGSFPIRKSYDLVMWEPTGASALPGGRAPWSANGGRNWAPEMHKVGERFIVYFTAVNGNNVLSIGASTSDSPEGPFVDSGQPLVEHPDGVIDAHYVRDGAHHYLVYKIDGNAHGRPTPNYIRELAPDGLSFLPGAPEIELIRNNSATWEGGVVEGSWITKHDGMYYLFYSGNVYDHRYRTGVARANSITGPYEKFGPPILTNNNQWVGPGHGSVVHARGKPYFIYHAWRNNGSGQNVASEGRRIVLDAIVYENGWPRIHNGTPSVGRNPWPGEN
jgi:beta-xylosidase